MRFVARLLAALSLLLAGCERSESAKTEPGPPPQPAISAPMIRGGTGETVSFPLRLNAAPRGAVAVAEWTLDLRLPEIEKASIRAGAGAPPLTRVSIEPAREGKGPVFRCRAEAPEGASLESGEIAIVTFRAPGRIVKRTPIALSEARWIAHREMGGGPLATEADTIAFSLFYQPVSLFAFLAGVVALIFWLGRQPRLQVFFRYFPPLIWTYFVPMMTTTFGVTPDDSPLYSPFMSRVILPATLTLLLIPSDVKGILKLGWKALFMMLFATLGIVLGAIGSFALIHTLFPSALPPGTWKGVAALSGSWIGGSPNMFAVIESVGTPPSIIGPLVVVDTVCAYSWLGLLIALSAYQRAVDRRHRADSALIEEISAHLEADHERHARDPKVADIALMIGVAFVVSQLCLRFGGPIHAFFTERLGWRLIGDVINAFGWGILLLTAAGLALSFTRVRELDYCGASAVGYVGLYLLLTTYGARANLAAVLEMPAFFALGAVWILIHIAVLYVGMRLLRAPLFLAATSSMANIGGTASAPVVAAAYYPSMAPVGLLMAILGSVIGTPLALFVVAVICKIISGQ